MFSKEIFGARMRQAREKLGKTQCAAAKDLHVTSTMLSDMERGRRTTTTEKLAALCEYYGVSADYLLGLKDDPQ